MTRATSTCQETRGRYIKFIVCQHINPPLVRMSDALLRSFPAAATEDIRNKLGKILEEYALEVDDLHIKWEAYATNNVESTEMNITNLDAFEGWLRQRLERPRKRQKISSTPARFNDSRPIASPAQNNQLTPKNLMTSDTPRTPGSRAGAINGGLEISGPSDKVEVCVQSSQEGYRPMFQKMPEVSQALDEQIENVISRFLEDRKLKRADLSNPTRISQSTNLVIGRILAETTDAYELTESSNDNADADLDISSLVLETSRRIGAGARVRLDASMLKGANFFRGQVVAIRGTNPTGQCYVAHQLEQLPRLPSPPSEIGHINGVVRIAVFSGPFTSKSSLDYSRLGLFLDDTEDASVRVILGPLVDDENEIVKTGTEGTPEDILATRVRPLLAGARSPVVYIPSTHDAAFGFPAFPQPPCEIDENVISAPNPACVQVGNMTVLASSIPGIKDIADASTGPISQKSAFDHILRQHRLYPVYPPAAATFVDISHALDLNQAPNVLIIPGFASASASISGGVICINPGYASEGSYAVISVTPGDGGFLKHTRVDLIST